MNDKIIIKGAENIPVQGPINLIELRPGVEDNNG